MVGKRIFRQNKALKFIPHNTACSASTFIEQIFCFWNTFLCPVLAFRSDFRNVDVLFGFYFSALVHYRNCAFVIFQPTVTLSGEIKSWKDCAGSDDEQGKKNIVLKYRKIVLSYKKSF